MQILNISVQNRPTRTVTSRPYALFHMEAIGASFNFEDILVNAPLEVSDSISSAMDYEDMQYIKEVSYRTLTVPSTPMFSVFDHGDVDILKDVTYTTMVLGVDNLESAFDVDDPVIRIALFTRTIEPLFMWSTFAVDDIQILEDTT